MEAARYLADRGVCGGAASFLQSLADADERGQSIDWSLENTVLQQRQRPAWNVRNNWGDARAYGAPHYNGWAAAPTTTITGMTYGEFRSEAARLFASAMMQDDPCDTSPSQIKVTVDNTPWE